VGDPERTEWFPGQLGGGGRKKQVSEDGPLVFPYGSEGKKGKKEENHGRDNSKSKRALLGPDLKQ